jgi:hypothetical protein
MNPSPELVRQIAREMEEITNAPPIVYGPTIPTCHFCGRIVKEHERTLVEVVGPDRQERFRGRCCGG